MSISTYTHSIKFDVPNLPIKGMTFYLNRVKASENTASLEIRMRYLFGHNRKKTEYVKNYLSEMFNNREIKIHLAISEYDEDFEYVDCVFIETAKKIRQVVDIMKANKLFTQLKDGEVYSYVREMEENLQLCSRVENSITDSQTECIKEKVKIYIDIITQHADNSKQALDWIKEHIDFLKGFERVVYPAFGNELRDALIKTANVYSSRANLENTFAKLHVYLPSGKMIKEVILNMLNENFDRKYIPNLFNHSIPNSLKLT